jgi:hypothetical protein
VTYTPSANELAHRYERLREYLGDTEEAPRRSPRGTLSLWFSVRDLINGEDPIWQSEDVTMQMKESGAIVTYDENGDAEIWVPQPGWIFNFVLDRDEG